MAKWNLRSRIRNFIRRCFLYSPERREALNKAKVGDKYKCNKCKRKFLKRSVCVDHIDPVVDIEKGFPQIALKRCFYVDNWTIYIHRMFNASNLQVLCNRCHDKKTRGERKQRDKAKKSRLKK